MATCRTIYQTIFTKAKLFDEISSQVLVSENEIKDEYIINNTNFTINALVVDNSSFNSERVESNKEEIKIIIFRIKKNLKKRREILKYVLWEKKPSKNDTLLTYSTVDEILMKIDKEKNLKIWLMNFLKILVIYHKMGWGIMVILVGLVKDKWLNLLKRRELLILEKVK